MITQALSYRPVDQATFSPTRTGKGGLRPVDFLHLIDAARLKWERRLAYPSPGNPFVENPHDLGHREHEHQIEEELYEGDALIVGRNDACVTHRLHVLGRCDQVGPGIIRQKRPPHNRARCLP